MLSPRGRALVVLIVAMLAFSGLVVAPARVRADDDEATRIYELARSLFYQNADQGGYTVWVNGDVGQDTKLKITTVNGGDPIPDFKFTSFNGKTTMQPKDMKGPYILNFWASWCPPCRAEFPMFAKSVADKTLEFPVIFVNTQDLKADAQTFLISLDAKTKLTVLIDPHSALYQKMGFQVIPDTILVDADGNVQAIQIGEMNDLSLKFFIEIATHPGVGSFDRLHPDDQPADSAATPAPEGTPDVTPESQP